MTNRKIATALAGGYLCAAAWTIYADIVYHNRVPLDAVLFHGLYPISLGLCAVATALGYDGNVKDIGFNRTKAKYYLHAAGAAALLTLLPFLIDILGGLVPLRAEPAFDDGLVAVGVPVLFLLGLGEEVMWRGILYTNVSKRLDFIGTSIVIGIAWGAWHYPVIIHTKFVYGDRPLWFALVMLTALCVCLSFILDYLRARSGSVWPCALFHAAINYIGFVLIEPMESDAGGETFLFRSDIGIVYILVAAAMAIAATVAYGRTPGERNAAPRPSAVAG